MRRFVNFFFEGFKLANKNFGVIAIALLLQPLLAYLSNITWLLLFFSIWVFNLSIPAFYLKVIERGLNLKVAVEILLNNARRLILSGIIILPILIFGIMVVLALYILANGGDFSNKEATILLLRSLMQTGQFSWFLGIGFFLLTSISSVLFLLLPVYFSVERLGLFQAAWKNFGFVAKNLPFALFMGCLVFLFGQL